jgi:hypothetical protein
VTVTALYRVDFPAGALGVELGPRRWDQVLDREDVFAAIPAPPFGERGPELALRDIGRQVQVLSQRDGDGVIFCVEKEGVTARRGGSPTRGARVAVQLFQPLVEAGVVVAPDALDYAPRTALVLRRDGGLTFVATRGATAREFAQEIVDTTGGLWAATTMVGDDAAVVTRQGLLFGQEEAAANAWLVARRPGVSPTRMASLPAPPELVPADRALSSVPRAAVVTAPSPAPVRSDILPVAAGIALLLAAAWWYVSDRKEGS